MPSNEPPVVVTVAGLDPSGGAGILADVATFRALACQPSAVAASLTVQDSRGVRRYEPVPPALVRDQLQALLEDLAVAAIKTGMLGSADNARAVADVLAEHPGIPLVVDPVLAASTGDALAREGLADALRIALLPRATVVTPNLDEAAALTEGVGGVDRSAMQEAARRIEAYGCSALITGGHLADDAAADLLRPAGGDEHWLEQPRVSGPAPRGTGCRHSAALAAGLARGCALLDAAREAQQYLASLLARPHLTPGGGAPHLDDLKV